MHSNFLILQAIREAEDWLKSHSTPWEIVLSKWKLTADYRQKIVKSNRNLKLCKIFEQWPILKHPNAHTLIEEDYAFLNIPALKVSLDSWKNFVAKILKVRPPKKDDHNAQSLLELLQHEELNDGIFYYKITLHVCVRARMCVLHYFHFNSFYLHR